MQDPRPGDAVPSNRDGNQQINYIGERYGWVVALLIGIVALLVAVVLLADLRSMRGDLENIRGLIENSAASASQSAADSAVAAERADKAERGAKLAEVMSRQVFVELNRLGYPVLTSAEPHPLPPSE